MKRESVLMNKEVGASAIKWWQLKFVKYWTGNVYSNLYQIMFRCYIHPGREEYSKQKDSSTQGARANLCTFRVFFRVFSSCHSICHVQDSLLESII